MSYLFYSNDGEIHLKYDGECLEQMIELNPTLSYLESSIDSTDDYYILDETLVEKPVQPTPFHRFDYSIKDWILPSEQFDLAKTKKKQDITNYANWLHLEPIEYDNKLLDADHVAQQNISGKITELKNNIDLNITSFLFVWRDANNNDHTWSNHIDYLTWLQGLFNAISARRTNLYTISWQGKAEVESMSTIEQIQQYDVEALFQSIA